jgi:LPXTG-motif cell wall-anchored protein
LQDARDDLRTGMLSALVLALAGLPAGLIWLWLAPRGSYRVTATGVEPLGGTPSPELLMADDGVYVLILAGLGLLAGLGVWLLRRHRGVVVLAALAAGMIAAALVAWQLGELLGPGPTREQLADVGATVTTGLRLRAVAAVAVGPFVAVLTYLVAGTLTSRDDLGRTDGQPAPRPVGLAAQQRAV